MRQTHMALAVGVAAVLGLAGQARGQVPCEAARGVESDCIATYLKQVASCGSSQLPEDRARCFASVLEQLTGCLASLPADAVLRTDLNEHRHNRNAFLCACEHLPGVVPGGAAPDYVLACINGGARQYMAWSWARMPQPPVPPPPPPIGGGGGGGSSSCDDYNASPGNVVSAAPSDFDPNATGTGDGTSIAGETSTTPCTTGGQGGPVAQNALLHNGATLRPDTVLISGYGKVPIPSVLTLVDGRLVLSYEIPRLALETGVIYWTLRSNVYDENDRLVKTIVRLVTVDYHDSDMTGDTHLDTLDIIEAVDRFVQGEITFETVAQVIDDVATAATP